MRDDRQAIAQLRLVASAAETLANDLEHGRLWEGDFRSKMGVIQEAVNAAARLGPPR